VLIGSLISKILMENLFLLQNLSILHYDIRLIIIPS
jgi:hypothetical protein